MKSKLRLGIIGARGIGKVHARVFHALGVQIVALLGSSADSSKLAAEDLNSSFGVNATPYHEIETFLVSGVDAVVICSPPHLHLPQILACLDQGITVFCEKPLFWDSAKTPTQALKDLQKIKSHPNRRLFLNSPNAYFLEQLQSKIPTADQITNLKFSFYTNGKYQGEEIGVDLFTHGLSILLKLFGERQIEAFKTRVSTQEFEAQFKYGTSSITFDFKANPLGAKHFALTLNDQTLTRVQEGSGSQYRVFFVDSRSSDKIEVRDSFIESISRFIDGYANSRQDGFQEAEFIMTAMITHLLDISPT